LRTGIILGLSLITKKTLFYLIPGIFIIYFYLFFSSGKNFAVVKQILISFLIVLLISSWFFIRNKVIYSDILALQMERSTMQSLIKEKSIFSFYFITPFSPSIVRSFIGVFGWMNLPLHTSIYIVYLIPMLSSVAGLYRYLKSKDKQFVYVYSLIIFFAICLGGIIYFNLTFTQSQGRYMFPVLSSISLLFTIGITTIIKKYKISEIMIYIITVFFVITDLLSIFTLYNFYY
jgi:4-amino-4-deoxy-L-arabinose transferase-like glycosyltransferase